MRLALTRVTARQGMGSIVLATVACAWGLMLGLIVFDQAALIDHDAVFEDTTLPGPVAIALFLIVWQLMTAAMMLPTSLPMLQAFARVVRGQPNPRAGLAAFVAGYAAIWTAFAVLALLGDAGLHWLVDRWTWLDERPWLISGGLLMGAGAFQFSPLKERCLAECRSPLQFLWRHYRSGIGGSWRLGVRHGLFCLGCCWALMLIMFAVGVGSLAWMAGLTGVMVIEKTSRFGRRLVPAVGTALLGWGALIILRPGFAAAHAGEVHASAGASDLLLGVGIVGLSIAVVAVWRRLRRSPPVTRASGSHVTRRLEGGE